MRSKLPIIAFPFVTKAYLLVCALALVPLSISRSHVLLFPISFPGWVNDTLPRWQEVKCTKDTLGESMLDHGGFMEPCKMLLWRVLGAIWREEKIVSDHFQTPRRSQPWCFPCLSILTRLPTLVCTPWATKNLRTCCVVFFKPLFGTCVPLSIINACRGHAPVPVLRSQTPPRQPTCRSS